MRRHVSREALVCSGQLRCSPRTKAAAAAPVVLNKWA
jgi:hypothetical protein